MKSYLSGEAYDNVKQLKKEDNIWARLETNFSDVRKLLKKRMN